MLRNPLYSLLAIIMVVWPNVALCQNGPGGKWWYDARVSKQLNLTEEEKTSLDKQYVKSRRKLIELKGKVEKEQFEFENLLESEEMDEEAVKRQFKKLDKARTNLDEERVEFLMQYRKILGNQRFQDIKGIYKNKEMNRQKKHRNK